MLHIYLFTDLYLIYNVVLVSGVQQSDLVSHIYIIIYISHIYIIYIYIYIIYIYIITVYYIYVLFYYGLL